MNGYSEHLSSHHPLRVLQDGEFERLGSSHTVKYGLLPPQIVIQILGLDRSTLRARMRKLDIQKP